ncbi:hypothetical protein POF51_26115 [Brevibacillus sp. AG]|uniref:hypothetical protein n=1 Tax=Brevibacillus sp. AG TaxID=3020891 RepID=UPI00232CE4EF|nr:hypothetical protein [Brevibacillus sp. AG]MDC0764199.1 hypothetical protein [Brevibacillus sp. AG]
MDDVKFVCYLGKNALPKIEVVYKERVWETAYRYSKEYSYYEMHRKNVEGDWILEFKVIDGKPEHQSARLSSNTNVTPPVSIADTFNRLATMHPSRTNTMLNTLNGLSLTEKEAAKPKLKVIKGGSR